MISNGAVGHKTRKEVNHDIKVGHVREEACWGYSSEVEKGCKVRLELVLRHCLA